MQRETTPNLLKTQTGRHRKNRQSNRQNPEITGQAHQSRVLRSLHLQVDQSVNQILPSRDVTTSY
ncbi:hypothetical protein CFR75_17395 [Komagataeibacter xylinus]|uniref:Uncharacterized protein n=1 Tax=Komagataeibacter xylinus TaxID=28448 RepID=A0A318PDR4_KOMXY|nr:hypothetical protein CFR75_17395 [Komagataeibacter xylinus]